MYYELTWLAVALLAVGVVAIGVPLVRLLVRAARDRSSAREGRRSLSRRLGPGADRS